MNNINHRCLCVIPTFTFFLNVKHHLPFIIILFFCIKYTRTYFQMHALQDISYYKNYLFIKFYLRIF